MSAHLSAEEFMNLKQEFCSSPLIVICSSDHVARCCLREVKCFVIMASDKFTLFDPHKRLFLKKEGSQKSPCLLTPEGKIVERILAALAN